MNKRGIDITPSVLLGLLIGAVLVIGGLYFLWQIFFTGGMETETDSFTELKEKISKLEDGKDGFIQFKSTEDGKEVIGFDKSQEKFEARLKTPSRRFREPEFGQYVTEPGKEVTFTYTKPDACGKESACLCSCSNGCSEQISCYSIERIENIEGKTHYEEIFSGYEVVSLSDNNTFLLPMKNGRRILLTIKREKETIFINS